MAISVKSTKCKTVYTLIHETDIGIFQQFFFVFKFWNVTVNLLQNTKKKNHNTFCRNLLFCCIQAERGGRVWMWQTKWIETNDPILIDFQILLFCSLIKLNRSHNWSHYLVNDGRFFFSMDGIFCFLQHEFSARSHCTVKLKMEKSAAQKKCRWNWISLNQCQSRQSKFVYFLHFAIEIGSFVSISVHQLLFLSIFLYRCIILTTVVCLLWGIKFDRNIRREERKNAFECVQHNRRSHRNKQLEKIYLNLHLNMNNDAYIFFYKDLRNFINQMFDATLFLSFMGFSMKIQLKKSKILRW